MFQRSSSNPPGAPWNKGKLGAEAASIHAGNLVHSYASAEHWQLAGTGAVQPGNRQQVES